MSPLLRDFDAGGSGSQAHVYIHRCEDFASEVQIRRSNLQLDLLFGQGSMRSKLTHVATEDRTLGCIVNMSSVRSVDSRRSRSMAGMVMLAFESRPTEEGAVLCETKLLAKS